MISFRYHIVSIVAVFLALGLGLLAGSSFGQPALVEQLRGRTEAQVATIDDLRSELDADREELAALRAFAQAAAAPLIAGVLEGREVLIVADASVDGTVEGRARAAFELAGADVLFTLSARPALATDDPAQVAALADILGVAAPGEGNLADATATVLARRLVAGPPVAGADPLVGLLTGGFVASTRGEVDEAVVSALGGSDLIVLVLVGGGGDAPEPSAADFFIPLVRELTAQGAIVAAGQSAAAAFPWVDAISTSAAVVVGDLDRPSGGTALVLGIRRMLLTGEGGRYGAGGEPLPGDAG